MTVLVTGADGFVGRILVGTLREAGLDVTACFRAGTAAPIWPDPAVRWLPLELADAASVARVAAEPCAFVVHLAGLASGSEARRDPGVAWEVNAAGTARLVEALAGRPRQKVLVVSTGEVYGAGRGARARTERDPLLPVSPYAASKVGAEVAAFETRRRTGLPVVVARPFPHTGPGQAEAFVAPAFAGRLREARASGAASVRTGSLQPVRDFTDVRDVAAAYLLLLQRGEPGEAYNVASGTGTPLHELFTTLAGLVGTAAVPEVDPALVRTADVPHLVGDATKLRERTGWVPRVPLLQTLRDLVDAQAH